MEKLVEEFIKDRNASQMLSFIKSLKAKDWDILFLVTRKGFWIYQLLADYDEAARLENPGVYSDRYLLKATDRSFLRGKKIYLVDDTMSSGYNLFRYFCILKKEEAKEIIPVVYALNTEFPRESIWENWDRIYYKINGIKGEIDEKKRRMAKEARQDFLKCLQCYRYLSPQNISSLCMRETELFQKTLCPMVIDLPMLVSHSENGKVFRDNFVLSEERFRKLCAGAEHWEYHSNVYGRNNGRNLENSLNGRLKIPVQCDYFEYHDDIISRLYDYFLINLVVKCKYIVDSDGKYHVVFTPFAIVRSFQKPELKEVFERIFGNTQYGNVITGQLDSAGSDYAWTAALRSIIYAFSLYVGGKFQELLGSVGISETGYDWKLTEQNSEEIFINTMKALDMSDAIVKDIVDYCVSSVPCGKFCYTGSQKYSEELAYEDIRLLVTGKNSQENRGVSIEKIEEILTSKYCFTDYNECMRKITGLILIMLEISVLGNCIQVTDSTVERGFKHGENSELLLSDTGVLCYLCAEVLYISGGKSGYRKYFDQYFEKMIDFLNKNNYFKKGYSEEQFNLNVFEFQAVPDDDLHMKIMEKRFLLENLEEDLECVHEYAIDVTEQMMGGTV